MTASTGVTVRISWPAPFCQVLAGVALLPINIWRLLFGNMASTHQIEQLVGAKMR